MPFNCLINFENRGRNSDTNDALVSAEAAEDSNDYYPANDYPIPIRIVICRVAYAINRVWVEDVKLLNNASQLRHELLKTKFDSRALTSHSRTMIFRKGRKNGTVYPDDSRMGRL